MIEIKFKGKIRQWSNSFIVTVPMSYIDNNLLAEGKTYEFNCKEIKTEDAVRVDGQLDYDPKVADLLFQGTKNKGDD